MLTRLLLYGCATGLTSFRRIEKATCGSIPFRSLAADQHPDHGAIANFRRQHLEALAQRAGAGLLHFGRLGGYPSVAEAIARWIKDDCRHRKWCKLCDRQFGLRSEHLLA